MRTINKARLLAEFERGEITLKQLSALLKRANKAAMRKGAKHRRKG